MKKKLQILPRGSIWVTLVKIAVCIILVCFIITKFNINETIQILKQADISVLILILTFFIFANLFIFLRWFLVMRYMDIRVDMKLAARCYQ